MPASPRPCGSAPAPSSSSRQRRASGRCDLEPPARPVILLHPPSTFRRCFQHGWRGGVSKMAASRRPAVSDRAARYTAVSSPAPTRPWLTAAVPMENPCCSSKLTLDLLLSCDPLFANSCSRGSFIGSAAVGHLIRPGTPQLPLLRLRQLSQMHFGVLHMDCSCKRTPRNSRPTCRTTNRVPGSHNQQQTST